MTRATDIRTERSAAAEIESACSDGRAGALAPASATRPGSCWGDRTERCEGGIRERIGHSVRSVEIGSGRDLRATFSGGRSLSVVPDHVGPHASFDGKWEVRRPEQAPPIGADLKCEVIDRQNRPLGPRPAADRWKAASRAESDAEQA